jgi:fructose-1,6-bisphosphatase I
MAQIEATPDLEAFLDQHVAANDGLAAASVAIREIASKTVDLAELVALGPLAGRMGESRSVTNEGGDVQKELDVVANDLFVSALQHAPVAIVLSEELDEPLVLDASAPLVVAIDPLDGSSNIDTNVSIGTIFSILPVLQDAADTSAHFLQPGSAQLASGFAVYGPQTSLVIALGGETRIFTYDRRVKKFLQIPNPVQIPAQSSEYAINASNYRHWAPSVQAFVDACVQGAEGPHGRNFNMRWIASAVAEAYRILLRGGVYIYPSDARPGYGDGRLRLVYEANPMALIVENAGGSATDGLNRILDLVPKHPHVHVPLVFGSASLVELIARYHLEQEFSTDKAPLFGRRGLMRV